MFDDQIAYISALQTNALVLIGLVLVLGSLFGDAAERMNIPWITGCILVGVLLGPGAIDILRGSRLGSLEGFMNASLALIAFNIGSQLTTTRLRKIGIRIALLTSCQLLMPLVLVLGLESFVGLTLPAAMILSSVAPATAPTTTYAIVQRLGAKGPFVDHVLGVLALNDAVTILVFSVVSSAAIALSGTHADHSAILNSLRAAALTEGVSILFGGGIGLLYLAMRKIIEDGTPEWESRVTASLLGLIIICIGGAITLGLSHLLTPLSFGITFANGVREVERQRLHTSLKLLEGPLFIVFFVLAGAHLPLSAAEHLVVLWLALLYLSVRFAGKYLGIFLTALALRYDRPTRNYLGLCFPAQGGLAMGLILSFRALPAVTSLPLSKQQPIELAVSIVLVGVLLSQLIGPLVIDYAVRRGVRDTG